ncbi:DUF6999 family protein, partial [Chamaesiphon sp. OTE_8_metabat_110]|uniref:DUF6999 family protein n=1 Tax=Chamaesiphon sp. OTE_8_metabat_110 TaxID=2964696 RepID=UPI00286C445E
WNHVIANRNPLAPENPFGAARRLLLHGIITEYLHRYLELGRAANELATVCDCPQQSRVE